jgi:hypothetical protein
VRTLASNLLPLLLYKLMPPEVTDLQRLQRARLWRRSGH